MALGAIAALTADMLMLRTTKRIGVTGLARAGKTALITSLAANLLALSAGRPALPAVVDRLRGRRLSASISPAEASDIPRFQIKPHTDALAADPPRWPDGQRRYRCWRLTWTFHARGFWQPSVRSAVASKSWIIPASGFSICH